MTMTKIDQKRMAVILIHAHEMAQRKFDEPAEQLMHELLFAAITLAGEHGRGRRLVAFGLGLAPPTLDTRLGAGPQTLTQESIARLMFDPAVLGTLAHRWLIEQMALRAGRLILMPVGDEQSEGVLREALGVGDAVGFLQMTSLQVTDPESDGGTAVTGTEQRKLAAAVGMVMQESGGLMTVGVMA